MTGQRLMPLSALYKLNLFKAYKIEMDEAVAFLLFVFVLFEYHIL